MQVLNSGLCVQACDGLHSPVRWRLLLKTPKAKNNKKNYPRVGGSCSSSSSPERRKAGNYFPHLCLVTLTNNQPLGFLANYFFFFFLQLYNFLVPPWGTANRAPGIGILQKITLDDYQNALKAERVKQMPLAFLKTHLYGEILSYFF